MNQSFETPQRPRVLVERPRADVEAVVGGAELVAYGHRVVDGVERELGGQRVREIENTLRDPCHAAIIYREDDLRQTKGFELERVAARAQ